MKKIILLISMFSSSAHAINMNDLQDFWGAVSPAYDMYKCINKYGQRKCLEIECIKVDYQHPSCLLFRSSGGQSYGNSCCGVDGVKYCHGTALPLNTVCFCPGVPGAGRVCQ